MITRYVLCIECTKRASTTKRLLLTYLANGGNNIKIGGQKDNHILTTVAIGEAKNKAPDDAHVFTVTPSSYNEWLGKIELIVPKKDWKAL